MAVDPAYASTPKVGAAIPGTAETSLTAPANASTVITGGTNGTMVISITVEAVTTSLTPTTVAGLVYLFLHDGTTAHLFDTITVTAVTASATVAPFRTKNSYTDLLVPNGWTLKASQSISGNANLLKVTAIAGDY